MLGLRGFPVLMLIAGVEPKRLVRVMELEVAPPPGLISIISVGPGEVSAVRPLSPIPDCQLGGVPAVRSCPLVPLAIPPKEPELLIWMLFEEPPGVPPPPLQPWKEGRLV